MEVLPLRRDIHNTELDSVLGFSLFSQIMMAVFVETFAHLHWHYLNVSEKIHVG